MYYIGTCGKLCTEKTVDFVKCYSFVRIQPNTLTKTCRVCLYLVLNILYRRFHCIAKGLRFSTFQRRLDIRHHNVTDPHVYIQNIWELLVVNDSYTV